MLCFIKRRNGMPQHIYINMDVMTKKHQHQINFHKAASVLSEAILVIREKSKKMKNGN